MEKESPKKLSTDQELQNPQPQPPPSSSNNSPQIPFSPPPSPNKYQSKGLNKNFLIFAILGLVLVAGLSVVLLINMTRNEDTQQTTNKEETVEKDNDTNTTNSNNDSQSDNTNETTSDNNDNTDSNDNTNDDSSSTSNQSTDNNNNNRPVTTTVSNVQWENCPAGASSRTHCAYIMVPLDYNRPNDKKIKIYFTLMRSRKPNPIGTLFVNPGGPGVSAQEMVFDSRQFDNELLDKFDLVGVDPRGVGKSGSKLNCGDKDAFLKLYKKAAIQGDEAAAIEAVKLCAKHTGEGAIFMHTENAARDIDQVRAALKIQQIHYYGSSYGSDIGAWYATLFDTKVKAMVLDAAENINYDRFTAKGRLEHDLLSLQVIEDRLKAALLSCQGATCPIDHKGDPLKWFIDNAHELEKIADYFDDFGGAPFLGVVTTLYSESLWPSLHEGLNQAVNSNNARTLANFTLWQLSNEEETDWEAWNITAHVNCLDTWQLSPRLSNAQIKKETDDFYKALQKQMPLLDAIPDLNWRYGLCSSYIKAFGLPNKPKNIKLNGGNAPIMVIGNTRDPIIGEEQSKQMVKTLNNAVYVKTSHPQHVAYNSDRCVTVKVHNFLIKNEHKAAVCP